MTTHRTFGIMLGMNRNNFKCSSQKIVCFMHLLFSFTHFRACFGSGESHRATALGGLAIRHGQMRSPIVLLVPHQDGNKQGQRCSHSTRSLNGLWSAFPWVQPAGLASIIFSVTFWKHGRTNVFEITRFGGKVARHSGLYEFHRCPLCREVSHRELIAKILSLPLALGAVFFQSLSKIHDQIGSEFKN